MIKRYMKYINNETVSLMLHSDDIVKHKYIKTNTKEIFWKKKNMFVNPQI